MKNIHYKIIVVPVFCLYLLLQAGCMVGPDYKPQDVNAPAGWAGTKNASSPDAMLVGWWTEFNDANLTSLIERAINSNLDVRIAQERIRQARASLGIVEAPFWPTANVTGSATRSRSPAGTKSNLFQTGLDAAWELDIFGGTRRAIESANADIQASIEDRRNTLVTLTSEVALNYVQLRGFQQEIIIAQNNLQSQQKSASVVRQKYEGGFVGALDVANADAQVATTMSQIPLLETSAQQAIYNISVLLGQQPTALLDELSPASSIPLTPPEIPAGLPSEMLRRRPDIRAAEARIHSATAQIGVATSDLFPKFNLAGSIGVQASQLNKLRWSSRTWSYGPSVDWQIFAANRVWSNIELQKSLTKEAMLSYQSAVLTALQDVENALVAYSKEQQRNMALIDAVAANRKAVGLSLELYSEGQIEFLNVLDAQRSLFSSEDTLVQSTRNLSTDLITLYKALGGGWDSNSQEKD